MAYTEIENNENEERILIEKQNKLLDRCCELINEHKVLRSEYNNLIIRYNNLIIRYNNLINRHGCSNDYEKLINEYKELVNLQMHKINAVSEFSYSFYLFHRACATESLNEFDELLYEIMKSLSKANWLFIEAIEILNGKLNN